MKTLSTLVINDLAIRPHKLIFIRIKICDACQFGKQVRSFFKSKNLVTTSRPLELLHIDLFGPMNVISMGANPMDLSLLMISLDSHEYIFLHIRMKHCIYSLSIARKSKMKKA